MKRRLVTHAWEESREAEHRWELDSDEEEVEEQTWDETELTREECIDEFLALMTSMLMSGAISARLFCVLIWWVSGFCDSEKLRNLGKKPGCSSGNYAKHIDARMGFKKRTRDFYHLQVPGHQRHDLSRTSHRLPALVGHEMLDDEIRNDPTVRIKLREAVEGGILPPAYHDSLTVQAAEGHPVVPCGIYVDAVPYSRTDSILGFWLINLISGSRHLMVTLRRRMTCRCGCRGWCSYDSIWRYIHWTVQCLASGEFPRKRHDGEDFEEEFRKELGGQKLHMRGMILFVKGDWAEFHHTAGFSSWKNQERPCMFCVASQCDLYQIHDLSPCSFPFHEVTDDDWSTACRRCEIEITVTSDLHRKLVPLLRYDKRQTGGHGLCLQRDIEGTPLRAKDRLEPSSTLQDIGMFWELDDFPIVLTFWRKAEQSFVHHRNPLWDQSLGLTPSRCLAVDGLHTLNLGIFQAFCKIAGWTLIEAPIWATQFTSLEERMPVVILCMRNEMQLYFEQRRKEHPLEDITVPNDITIKMLGTRTHPKLMLSGAETWAFMLYVIHAVKKYRDEIGASAATLAEAGECLVRIQCISRGTSGDVPPQLQQDQQYRIVPRRCSPPPAPKRKSQHPTP